LLLSFPLMLTSSRFFFSFKSQELRLSRKEIESLLVDLILDKRIKGQIDQVGAERKTGGHRKRCHVYDPVLGLMN